MGIPLIVHEQNSVPGMANTYLAKRADVTALTYEESAEAPGVQKRARRHRKPGAGLVRDLQQGRGT